MRRNLWVVKSTLLGVSLIVIVGVAASVPLRSALRERRLERTRKDFKEVYISTVSYGSDRCGCNYPPDTGVRRRETPKWPLTFETDPAYYKERAFVGINYSNPQAQSCTLTSPIAYMKAVPRDPFRSDGGFYAYFASETSPENIRQVGVLRSVGPDGREDLPLADMKEAVEQCMRQNPRQAFAMARKPEFMGWVRGMVDPYQYDPTNGATSRGDLIMVMHQCSSRYGWGGSDAKWAQIQPVGFNGEFKTEKPFPAWDFEQPIPTPRDYTQQLWAESRFRMPVELREAFALAGIHEEHGEFYAMEGAERKPFQGRLNRLRNHFGPFREFLQKPAPLTAEQLQALKAWRAEDPAWWRAVEAGATFDPFGKTEPARLSDFLDLMVIYGKSKTLLAAAMLAENDDRAYSQVAQLEMLLRVFYMSVDPVAGNPAATNPTPTYPFFGRVQEELRRLVREETALIVNKRRMELRSARPGGAQ